MITAATRALRRTWNRLLGSVLPGNARHNDSEVAEEFETHIQLLADQHVRDGLSRGEALRRARLEFGNVEAAKEDYREQRGLPFIDALSQDLRYALRGMRRNAGFTAVAVLSLGVGIGANTAIFSLVNTVLLKPLAYEDPDRLYSARELLPHLFGQQEIPVNPVHAREWAEQCPSLDKVAVMRRNPGDVASGGEPVSVPGADVQSHLFALLGVQPLLGRTFLPEEEQEGNDRVVLLSESLWRSRFQADPSLIGNTIQIDGQLYQVVGVVPAWFQLPFPGDVNRRIEMFRPLVLQRDEVNRLMGNYNYSALVRLKRGATVEQALAEVNVVQARFPRRAGSAEEVKLKATLTPVQEVVTRRARVGLWMLSGAVGAVLLIVCINLANLLLSRMAARRREAAIRTAIGASRGRQFRMVLTESLLLAISGGTVGLLLATWALPLLLATAAVDIPRVEEITVDSRVLLFSLGLTLLTGLLFGVLPAWRLTSTDPQAALRSGSHTVTEGRGGLRLREALITLEVGLSAALLVLAGLLTSSFAHLLDVDKGFDTQHVLAVDIGLSGRLYAEPANREAYFNRLLSNVTAIPGVQAAGFTTDLPTRGENWQDPIYLPGDGRRESERHPVNNRYTSPGYFRAMNIVILRGRAFDEADRGRQVAVLSEKAARLLWPGNDDPIGRTFIGEDDKPKTLVGVAGEVRADLHREPPPMAYYPYWQRVPVGVTLAVRTTPGADPRAAAGSIRAALREQDPQLPVQTIRTMEEEVGRSVAQRRFQMLLMVVFAISALLVASLGIYGVVSYSVSRRRNEIGIRMALGAPRSRLLGMVVRQGMAPVLLGLGAGVIGALLLGRTIRGLLFGIQPTDPMTILAATVLLLLVGIFACLLPARRATSMDAVAALRFE